MGACTGKFLSVRLLPRCMPDLPACRSQPFSVRAKSRESGTRIRQYATCPVRRGRSTKRSDTETIECRRLSQTNEGVDWPQYLVSCCLKWHSMLEAWSTTHRGFEHCVPPPLLPPARPPSSPHLRHTKSRPRAQGHEQRKRRTHEKTQAARTKQKSSSNASAPERRA